MALALQKVVLRSKFAAAALAALWAASAQQKQNPNFTGTVTRVTGNSEAAIAHFRFEAGARTRWHSHEGGQIILVEDGVCRTQVKGGPVVELHAGETTYVQPGVPHWHGAAPGQACTQFNVTRGKVNWLEEVTEKEYTAPAKK
ncbi:MAG TPA: cupin domain-containing protein [Bryobacteraceae bacterium]|nr:cupin domain-containing protein [Bryobacteraceae bacterium]